MPAIIVRKSQRVPILAITVAAVILLTMVPHVSAADVFSDGFESGSTASWSAATRFTVQQQVVSSGSWAGRATANNSTAFAWKTLSRSLDQVVVSAWVNVRSRTTATHLLSVRTNTGSAIAATGINTSGRLMVFNPTTGVARHSPILVSSGWHSVELAVTTGTSGQIDVWYDGAQVPSLDLDGPVSGAAIARVMVGNNVGGRTFDVAFDDVLVSEARGTPIPDAEPPSTPTDLTAVLNGPTGVRLTWTASSDDVGVEGYTIHRSMEGTPPVVVGTATTTSFEDVGLAENTTFTYWVEAFDASGKRSMLSDPASTTTEERPPDIVVVLTDDQPADTLDRMSNVRAHLIEKGTTFTNAIVSNSYCCPSRVSLLRGQYSHTTGIYDVAPPFGGYTDTRRWKLTTSTLATWLHGAGYRTGYVGKYLNGYGVGEVPPGYDYWRASNQAYFNYKVSENGIVRSYGSSPSDYHTSVMSRYADSFIRSTPASRPLFLEVGTYAPHGPFTPEPKYATDGRCSTVTNTDNPAYNESDVSDKPTYIREKSKVGLTVGVEHPRAQCRTLLSVDDLVGTVMEALTDSGRLESTLVLYTSDNGYSNGEHRWGHKVVPYEGSIKVPFVIRYDPLTEREPRVDPRLVANIDIAPTIVDLLDLDVMPGCPDPPYGGTCSGTFDGVSLIPLLDDTAAQWRDAVLLEQFNTTLDVSPPTYCGVRTSTHVFVRYATAEEEMYDLTTDPWQLTNLLGDGEVTADDRSLRDGFVDKLFGADGLCRPTPPGYSAPAPD